MLHENIWVASESTANSLFKSRIFKVYDYISDLDIQSDKLVFTQKDLTLDFENITNIRLGKQRLSIAFYILVPLLIFISVFGDRTLIIFGLILLLGIAISFQPWVVISYTEGGKTKQLYLADGNAFGYKGLLGGTRVLFTALERAYNAHRSY